MCKKIQLFGYCCFWEILMLHSFLCHFTGCSMRNWRHNLVWTHCMLKKLMEKCANQFSPTILRHHAAHIQIKKDFGISFGHSSTYLSQADVSSQCSFWTNPFSCQHWTRSWEASIQDLSCCVMRTEWINSSTTTKNLSNKGHVCSEEAWSQ